VSPNTLLVKLTLLRYSIRHSVISHHRSYGCDKMSPDVCGGVVVVIKTICVFILLMFRNV